jgi:UDP-2,3-diacylglucosamine pyrophosphatase LpxH
MITWEEIWPTVCEIVPTETDWYHRALAVEQRTGKRCSSDGLRKAWAARGGSRGAIASRPHVSPPTVHAPPAQTFKGFEDLMRHCKRGVGFEELCDRLNMPPSRVRGLISEAQAAGYRVDFAGDVVAQREPKPAETIVDIGIAPIVGGRHYIGVIGDIHAGSKFFKRAQMVEFIRRAFDEGVRHMFITGDLLDGCYDHGRWELSHHGIDDQTTDLLETLPRIEGLSYHYITGNHDETFTRSTGLDTGRSIMDRARSEGRTDLYYYGCRGGLLKMGTVKVELWHPKPGKAYALSYQLQNKIRDMPAATGRKPDILIAGHWHTFCYFEQRGIHAIASPCWQGGGSSFGKSLGGAPSIGGLIVSWKLTEHGTLRRVRVEREAYYDVEHYREVAA